MNGRMPAGRTSCGAIGSAVWAAADVSREVPRHLNSCEAIYTGHGLWGTRPRTQAPVRLQQPHLKVRGSAVCAVQRE